MSQTRGPDFATGRSLPPVSQFANDDGRVVPEVAAALAGYAAGRVAVSDLVEVLRGQRLLVPVLAHAEGHETPTIVVGVTTADGRTALPVFSSVDAMREWHPPARPIPVTTEQAAFAAIDEEWNILVLDPGGSSILFPRPAVVALMTGTPWQPAVADGKVAPEVVAAVSATLAEIGSAQCEPGDRSELRIVVEIPAATPVAERGELATAVTALLAADHVVTQRVDSLEVVFRPGA
jgi:hypothetical protein